MARGVKTGIGSMRRLKIYIQICLLLPTYEEDYLACIHKPRLAHFPNEGIVELVRLASLRRRFLPLFTNYAPLRPRALMVSKLASIKGIGSLWRYCFRFCL